MNIEHTLNEAEEMIWWRALLSHSLNLININFEANKPRRL